MTNKVPDLWSSHLVGEIDEPEKKYANKWLQVMKSVEEKLKPRNVTEWLAAELGWGDQTEGQERLSEKVMFELRPGWWENNSYEKEKEHSRKRKYQLQKPWGGK